MDLKHQSLKTVFIQYLLTIIVSIVLVVCIVGIGMSILMRLGIILPANYDEKIAFTLKSELEGKDVLRPEDFEGQCKYALFNNFDQLISSNIQKPDALQSYLEGDKQPGKYYVDIIGKNGYAVVEYELVARYRLPLLADYFPSVERVYLIILIGTIVLMIILVSNSYGKRLKRALEPIERAVASIGEQNLDFEVESSKINEFNDIGNAINLMKTALQESLTTQWQLEKKKREQMAALAHDIKTPLTIIKGSAQLLDEEETLDEEQHALSSNIIRNSDKIQEYLGLLMEMSTKDPKEQLNRQFISIEVFLNNILEQAEQLARIKNISVHLERPKEEVILELDVDLMSRALMNIISNAIEYTPSGRQMWLKLEKDPEMLSVQILDEGEGFTEKAIHKACDMFYMGDESRHHKGHYGMGLYIAKQIVRQHRGSLTIENQHEDRGGKVTINLPIT